MAKGDVKYYTLLGAIGTATKDYTTKQPDGNFRYGMADGVSFKCGIPKITGRVKLVEDEFVDNGTTKVFHRLLGVADSASQVDLVKALEGVEW